jgi:hypothetical protein
MLNVSANGKTFFFIEKARIFERERERERVGRERETTWNMVRSVSRKQ